MSIELLKDSLVEPSFEQVEQSGVDLSQCPEAILFFVAALAVAKPVEKPKVDDLEVLVFADDGQTKKRKPSAKERDDAFAFYQSLTTVADLVSATEAEQTLSFIDGEEVFLDFSAPHGRYAKGDKACFNGKDATRILAFQPPVAKQYTPE